MQCDWCPLEKGEQGTAVHRGATTWGRGGERPCRHLGLLASGPLSTRLLSEPPRPADGASLQPYSVHQGDDKGPSRLKEGTQRTLAPSGRWCQDARGPDAVGREA